MKKPNLVKAAQILFYFNAAVWLLFGVYTLVRWASQGMDQSIAMVVVGFLMFGNAMAMLLAGIGSGKPRRLFYLFAMAVLAVNIILTFTDQVGIFDILTLLVDLVLLVLLIVARSWYSSGKLTNWKVSGSLIDRDP